MISIMDYLSKTNQIACLENEINKNTTVMIFLKNKYNFPYELLGSYIRQLIERLSRCKIELRFCFRYRFKINENEKYTKMKSIKFKDCIKPGFKIIRENPNEKIEKLHDTLEKYNINI